MLLAPFFRRAGGLQSTYGVEFPWIMCWIIKTIITRTRQKSNSFVVYIIPHYFKKINLFPFMCEVCLSLGEKPAVWQLYFPAIDREEVSCYNDYVAAFSGRALSFPKKSAEIDKRGD